MDRLLEVRGLTAEFARDGIPSRVVKGIDFDIAPGEAVGFVGESGCGKSVTAMSIVRLLPQPSGKILGGHVYFKGRDLLRAGDEEMRRIRGGEIGVIFQEPMSALNPVHRIGRQVAEAIRLHKNISKKDAWDSAIEMLKFVRIPAPEKRAISSRPWPASHRGAQPGASRRSGWRSPRSPASPVRSGCAVRAARDGAASDMNASAHACSTGSSPTSARSRIQ